MDMLVVTDLSGEVVATGRLNAGVGSPTYARLIPQAGQSIQFLKVDDRLLESAASAAEIQERIKGLLPIAGHVG